MELAGEIIANGTGATRFPVGERVMGLIAGAGQAELAVLNERMLMAVPDKVDWAAAGGLPEVFTTAHDALFTQCGLQPGERLLVHGAAGRSRHRGRAARPRRGRARDRHRAQPRAPPERGVVGRRRARPAGVRGRGPL